MRPSTSSLVMILSLLGLSRVAAQATPPEVTEMRRRVAVIRAEMPAITAAAEDAADRLGRNPTSRLMVSKSWDKSFWSEMVFHGGGPTGVEEADESPLSGILLLPVRSWDGEALRSSMFAERQLIKNRLTIVIGSTAGAPTFAVGQKRLDNGAPDGTIAHSTESALANNIVAWTFVTELVAAASRKGWHPGILLTSIVPGAEATNSGIKWRVNDSAATHQIAPGKLGSAYLDEVDRVLQVAGSPARSVAVNRVANALRSVIGQGGKVYMASCMHWLSEELPRDSIARGGVRGFDWRWDTEKIIGDLTTSSDALVWFGYGGTDCPHIQPAGLFRQLKRATAVIAGPETAKPESDFLWIPQAWRLPDAAAPLPFTPGSVGPVATIEAGVTWLWMKRLLSEK
jgi:hypothetical protein